MTEKVDVYRMGMVFKKYLANGGVHFLGHDGGASDFEAVRHKSYNTVSYAATERAVRFAAAAAARRVSSVRNTYFHERNQK